MLCIVEAQLIQFIALLPPRNSHVVKSIPSKNFAQYDINNQYFIIAMVAYVTLIFFLEAVSNIVPYSHFERRSEGSSEESRFYF